MVILVDDKKPYVPPVVQLPPKVEPPKPQETVHVVKPKETLKTIGTDYNVDPGAIAKRNNLPPDAVKVAAGDNLVIPAPTPHDVPQPVTPAATPEQAKVDAATKGVVAAQDNLAAMTTTSGQGGGSPWPASNIATQQRQVDASKADLKTAIAEQATADANAQGVPLDAAAVQKVAQTTAQRHANDPTAQAAVSDAASDVEVDVTIANAGAKPDPKTVVSSISAALPALSAAAQNKLLGGPALDQLLATKVTPFITAPIQAAGADADRPEAADTLRQLDNVTAGADPRIAAKVVAPVLDTLEAAGFKDGGDHYIGSGGTASLIRVAGTLDASDPGAQALVNRMAGLSLDTSQISGTVSLGASVTLPLALAKVEQQATGVALAETTVFKQTLEGVRQFQKSIENDANAYVEHLEELNYAIASVGPAATPQKIEIAINNYVAGKEPEWQKRLDTLQNTLATDGAQLLDQVSEMKAAIAGMPADQQAALRGDLAAMLQDRPAQLAVTTALRQQPEMMRGAQGQRMLDTFAGLGITGANNVLATTATAAYLRENVLGPAANVDLTNAGSLIQARGALNTALRDNPALAQMMQVTPGQLDTVVDSLLDLVPATPTQAVDGVTATDNVARNLNNTLDKIDGALGRSTPFSLQFRTSALAIVSVGLVNSVDNFAENPSLRAGLQVVVDGARVGVDGAQFVTTLADNSAANPLVNGLKTAGKVVHLLGASLAGIDAFTRLGRGDLPGAGLNAAIAGGVGYAVFGASAMAGPIGFGVATVATLGLFVYDSVKASQYNSRFETQAVQNFLQDTGLDADAAAVLRNQSGEGFSPVPLLLQYAKDKGYDLADPVQLGKFQKWVNDMPADQLTHARNWLHHAMDEFDGDATKLGSDPKVEKSTAMLTVSNGYTASLVEVMDTPRTVGQLDAMLDEYGAPRLPPP